MAKEGYPSRTMQRVLRDRESAYVETPWAGTTMWYDRTEDPGELDGSAHPRVQTHGMDQTLQAWIDDTSPWAEPVLDDRLRQQLESLGYLD
jgi:hypothetical protein